MDSPEKYRKDFEIIRLTADQLIKDFGIHGIEIIFSGNELTAYDELKMQITPVLHDLFRNDRSLFQSVLYRIDINEKEFKHLLLADSSEFPEKLAEMVLQREFQKILIRKYFGEGKIN